MKTATCYLTGGDQGDGRVTRFEWCSFWSLWGKKEHHMEEQS